jgi:hypothetical protein
MALAKIYDTAETLMVPVDTDRAVAMSRALASAICLVKGSEAIAALAELEEAVDNALTAAGIDYR